MSRRVRKNNNIYAIDKPVSIKLLRPISECALIMGVKTYVLEGDFKARQLPFVAREIGKEIVCYLPSYAIRTFVKWEELGVKNVYSLYKYLYKERVIRLMKEDFDWSSYDLSKWK